MATHNKDSHRSLHNQMVGIKTWVCTTKYHLIQKTPDIRHTATFADLAFQNSTLQQNQEGHASSRSSSWRERNPRTTTIICENTSPPRRRSLLPDHRRSKRRHEAPTAAWLKPWFMRRLGPRGPKSGPDRRHRRTAAGGKVATLHPLLHDDRRSVSGHGHNGRAARHPQHAPHCLP
jgi:hypothetical protein